jgi:TIR domain
VMCKLQRGPNLKDIFLSYNREDAATAKRFADAFAAEGLTVWWDTALRSGEAYDEVTEAALRGAKAVVVLWSPRSVVSRWVRAEATIADRCKTLVPVTIEPCERPIMFELTQTAELSHWTGDAGDRAWRAFLSDVRGVVGRETSAPVAPVSTSEPAPEPASAKPGERGEPPSLAVLLRRRRLRRRTRRRCHFGPVSGCQCPCHWQHGHRQSAQGLVR